MPLEQSHANQTQGIHACALPPVTATNRPKLNPLLSLRPLQVHGDIEVIHPWYQMDYAHYWNMQDMTLEATRDFYVGAAATGTFQAYMGLHRNQPAFVMECYDPGCDEVGRHYDVQPGDIGMHFFTGPCSQPVANFTRDILRVVMAFLFDELGAHRVVVEPDLRNGKVHRLNQMVGFVNHAVIELPSKQAQLAFCTPADFANSLKG
ncbi:GNAT family N-acetyltransferase [Pseudomonas sp. EL_65y_Pfl2_R95]|uniref:GNAT family N-acetyltransferase n=1 Tax=Pseudomonas sp. EL_65y_Pfl2_R95 TaxID=3088698 RepID=UPI0030D8A978